MGLQAPGSLYPKPPNSWSSLAFLQGEPGKAGEKGLAGAPGLRVSVLPTAHGLVLVQSVWAEFLTEAGGEPLHTCTSEPGLSRVDSMGDHMLGCAGIHPESLWLLVGFRGKAEVQRKMSVWRKAEEASGCNNEMQGRVKADSRRTPC